MKVKKIICICVVVLMGITFLFASLGIAREKTPIEIYNPSYEFPTESITLNFWEIYGARPGWYDWARRVADEYTQIHSNVRITIREIPVATFDEMMIPSIEAGTLADVVSTFGNRLPGWENVFMPAPDWAVKIFETKSTNFANAYQSWKDNYWGWFSGEVDIGQTLYYNKSMFKEAGLDPNSPPKTSPELLDAMKKLTKHGPAGNVVRGGWGIRYFGAPAGITDKWRTFLAWWRDCEEGLFFTEDWMDVPAWDSEPYVKAVKFYQDMVWEWKVASVEMPGPVDAFKLGLVAMTNRESYFIGVLKNDVPDLEYGIAPLVNGAPPYGQYEVGVSLPFQLNCVYKKSRYPQVAWDFNMFLNTDEHELELRKITGGFVSRKANLDSDYVKSIFWKDVFDEMANRTPYRDENMDPWGSLAELSDLIGQAVETCITNPDADPKTELEKALKKARVALKGYIARKSGNE